MARGHKKNNRVYVGGYDLSGYLMEAGPLAWVFDFTPEAALSDAVKAGLPGHPSIQAGALGGFFDNTATSGLHVLYNTPGSSRIVTVALGFIAAPAADAPVFVGNWQQETYTADPDRAGQVGATVKFGEYDAAGETRAYSKPWGRLLHASAAATAANNGTADTDSGASSAAGGYGVLHVLAGNGTATFAIEHSATNTDGAFDASGAIVTFDTTAAATPFAEIKTTALVTTTVERYLRWQVTLGTATTVTFVMSFVRG